MARKDEIRKILEGAGSEKSLISEKAVDYFIDLEERLDELTKLPFIVVNDIGEQKSTPASKLYKELMSQYNALLRVFLGLRRDSNGDEESLLETYMKKVARV